jgi:hypothetical protein
MNTSSTLSLKQKINQLPTPDVLKLLNDSSLVKRVHSIATLLKRLNQDPSLLEIVKQSILNSENMSSRLMGTISVSHLGIAELFRIGSVDTTSTAWQIINSLEEPNRSDLIWYLKSENLLSESHSVSAPS